MCRFVYVISFLGYVKYEVNYEVQNIIKYCVLS